MKYYVKLTTREYRRYYMYIDQEEREIVHFRYQLPIDAQKWADSFRAKYPIERHQYGISSNGKRLFADHLVFDTEESMNNGIKELEKLAILDRHRTVQRKVLIF